MGSESIAHEAEGHEDERNCFSKIQLVVKNIERKQFYLVNAIQLPLFWFSKPPLLASSGL